MKTGRHEGKPKVGFTDPRLRIWYINPGPFSSDMLMIETNEAVLHKNFTYNFYDETF